MSQKVSLPTIVTEIGRLKRRLSRVERRLDGAVKITPYLCKWSYPGELAATASMFDTHPDGGVLSLLYAHLVVPGTTQSVFSARKNGVQYAQLIFPAGIKYAEVTVTQTVMARMDGLQMVCTQAGAGAENFSAFGVFASPTRDA